MGEVRLLAWWVTVEHNGVLFVGWTWVNWSKWVRHA
jgi:hypothetical protein